MKSQNVSPIPVGFKEKLTEFMEIHEVEALIESLGTDAPTSIRINREKWSAHNAFVSLDSLPGIRWCDDGFYLPERPRFAEIPQLYAGAFYVQEASSMAIAATKELFDTDDPIVLDLCAAPGGKSTLMRAIMPENGILISNEIIPNRAHILAENMTKWGHEKQVVTQSAPREWKHFVNFFDVVVVDAPCSGEGMFRKDMRARDEWSINQVDICVERQKDIIDAAWPLIKPGGFMVYSTCTFNQEENERQVEYIIDKYGGTPFQFQLDLPNMGYSKYPCYRFMPHITNGEGLFLAAIQKGFLSDSSCVQKAKNEKFPKTLKPFDNEIKVWLVDNETEKYFGFEHNHFLHAIPQEMSSLHERLIKSNITILSEGIAVGEIKGKKWIPTTALVLNRKYKRNSLPECELTKLEAITYLKREAITLPASIEKGIVVVTYKGLPLGIINHLGNRSNNLYPTHWRIRHLCDISTLN